MLKVSNVKHREKIYYRKSYFWANEKLKGFTNARLFSQKYSLFEIGPNMFKISEICAFLLSKVHRYFIEAEANGNADSYLPSVWNRTLRNLFI